MKFEDVYRVVRLIPQGMVMSYSGVARQCGSPRSARYVGFALHALPANTRVPWWRVINARGRISNQYAPVEQKRRLEAEACNARSRERRAQHEIVHRLEKEIHALETRQTELTSALQKPETYEDSRRTVEINMELGEIVARLRELTPAWETEATKLAEMDARGE